MKFTGLALVVVASQAVVGLALAPPAMPTPPIQIIVPSVLISTSQTQPSSSTNIDKTILKGLEKETKEAEKIAKADARKAKAERSREAFFEYEEKMAAEQEARIEAAEQKAIDEAIKDKKEAQRLLALEREVEQEANNSGLSKKEREAKLKVARNIMKKEREVERKERQAEKAERIFLAEEIQEQSILQRKEAAVRAVSKNPT